MTPARTELDAGNARPAGIERQPTTATHRGLSALGALALGIGGAFAVPAAAVAAPAPCEQADPYAAQSGAGLFRLNRPGTGDVVVAEAKSALVANAAVNAAAVTRLANADEAPKLSKPLIQQAPPTNAKPARRTVPATDLGPFGLGRGTLSSHAQWDPRMACGRASGNVTRAEAGLARMAVGEALLRVPKEAGGLSTTAVRPGARTVAAAGLSVAGLELLDGAVRIKVVRPPALTADMSAKHGGRVRYTPAVLEVSGDDIESTRLDTAGDVAEFTLGDEVSAGDPESPESDAPTEKGPAGPEPNVEPTTRGPGGLEGLFSGLPKLGGLTGGLPLPLPVKPELPEVGGATESAPLTGPGTRLRISLGEVRKATSGHAIAARATAINIAITHRPSDSRTKDGYAGDGSARGGVVLDLDVGVLEAAAVAPGPRGVIQGAVSAADDGGLPITGPAAGGLAAGGVALLAGGVAAVLVGMRRRRFRA